jgi:hypothetical protein
VTSKSFEDTYENKAKDLKRTLLEYVKTLMAVGNDAGAGPPVSSIQFDTDGFPFAPGFSFDKTTKEDLERHYHSYVTQHYRECLLPTAVSMLIFCVRTCLPR